ncbi:PAS domain-containing protein [Streptomyces ipomoeae]|uniref:Stage II sporulation protein E n=2 Tax=Streptomyces ipomoeae TaxID=103232 RepID=L1L8T0_9ACTN|nr:SpoIIE family protein phosphatase [Streptomyces ipomoeae]EKX69110.1 stage II sporulation protein E [Streptomyces ipomoeae 91-03]MDX2692869.1 SpoIIE family protein phosphatase [Streptomyces ipomoeae]MDX2820211.1 SpoIIE family protein phosphatase [Streptomyces ipomoeae]MDX2841978.1 SpoIIE family protein phosphatase [Streptomyces ipomoeae]MDX2874927.1 SpoIIE family protein phosphatase [Streptomyces ipomoeae]
MADTAIDYAAVFQALPGMVALLTPELVFADANEEFLRLAGRTREQVVGRYLFDVFPDNPADPGATGMRNLAASLERVAHSGERDAMALQRYDVESAQRPGEWEERYWSPVNAPLLGPDGSVVLLIHRVEEVSELIRAPSHPQGDRARVLEAELYTRARELQEINERLRKAHARERDVALALQKAMLPAPRPVRHHRAAVRYRPAVGALNVCGDWYDLIDLPGEDRIGVAVGDVVGHGLAAACAMGQLRSALSAASLVASGPARALDALGLYADSVEGAENTTVVQTCMDWETHTITYSSAGHLPPVLLRGDGTVVFLDRATDPPLGARPEHVARPQAAVDFTEGDTLVLYTDGLIERRHEDIDTGLARLADALNRHRHATPEPLADALLHDLLPPDGATDDTALVIIRL